MLGNYDVTYKTAEFTITQNKASVTVVGGSKTYGDTDPTLTGTLTDFVADDNVKATYTRVEGETVAGGPYMISATLGPVDVLGNYDITHNTAEFTINQRNALVPATAATKVYGASDPTLTGTLAGFSMVTMSPQHSPVGWARMREAATRSAGPC